MLTRASSGFATAWLSLTPFRPRPPHPRPPLSPSPVTSITSRHAAREDCCLSHPRQHSAMFCRSAAFPVVAAILCGAMASAWELDYDPKIAGVESYKTTLVNTSGTGKLYEVSGR